MWHFTWPWALLLLGFPAWHLYKPKPRQRPALKLTEFPAALIQRRAAPRQWLSLLSMACLIIAIARPQWGEWQIEHQARNVILALDVSGSMRTAMTPITTTALPSQQKNTRLTQLKTQVTHFLQGVKGDRIGLIVFADEAYTLSPLTTDTHLLAQLLTHVDNGMAGERTAIGSAIALSTLRLKQRKRGTQAVIIFTDGDQTSGEVSLPQATALAVNSGVRIYPVLIDNDLNTKKNANLSEKQRKRLNTMAIKTGGKLFTAHTRQTLAPIFQAIDRLETETLPDKRTQIWTELYTYPLLFGLLILLMEPMLQRVNLIKNLSSQTSNTAENQLPVNAVPTHFPNKTYL